MKNQDQPASLWTTTFIGLLVLGAFTATSFYMMNPIVSKYATLLGATLGLAGVVTGLFSITALTARPFGAVLVDRVNKKLVLSGATALMGAAALGYAISDSVTLLVAFRIVHGAAFAVSGTATTALIADIVPRERLGEGIGMYGMAYTLATAVGPNIGIFVADRYGYRYDFIVSGLALAVAALCMLRIPYQWTPPKVTGTKGIALSDMISFQVLPLALIGGIFSFTNGIVTSFLVLIGDQRAIENIGLYFTVMAICLFVVRPVAGRLADQKGLKAILYPSFALVALESALLANASVLWVVLVAAAAKAFGTGAARPALQSTCLKRLDPSKSGVAAATYFIGADIGQGVGPMIGGGIAQSHGYSAMFYFCIALLCVGFVGFVLYDAWEKKRTAGVGAEPGSA